MQRFSGARLRHARESRGMGRTELAYRAGVTEQRVLAYECGTGRPSLDRVGALAEALDVVVWGVSRARVLRSAKVALDGR
jgi:transcriptional regulator with XRE-family HTH domain